MKEISFATPGAVFGRLTVIGRDANKPYHVACRCSCGTEKSVNAYSLKDGLTQSCGCLRRERQWKHGRTGSGDRTYRIWQHVIQRCTNPNDKGFQWYGARGISVCSRWLGDDGFQNFLADMGEAPDGKSIDRIDNDRNYTPDNCHWATPLEQSRNSRIRKTAKLTPDKVREIRSLASSGMLQAEIASRFGIAQTNVSSVVRRATWANIE